MYFILVNILTFFCVTTFCDRRWKDEKRLAEAIEYAESVYLLLHDTYSQCFKSSMPSQRFAIDNLYNYINSYAKTTVGVAPQFTASRKFFVNMIAHPAFKTMLTDDMLVLQNNMVDKMKFCDESTLDEQLLKQLYDREVDQTKL